MSNPAADPDQVSFVLHKNVNVSLCYLDLNEILARPLFYTLLVRSTETEDSLKRRKLPNWLQLQLQKKKRNKLHI